RRIQRSRTRRRSGPRPTIATARHRKRTATRAAARANSGSGRYGCGRVCRAVASTGAPAAQPRSYRWRAMRLDCTFRVQIPHRPGYLAKVAEAIASYQGLIGDVTTVALGRDASLRDIT